jgi:hypothetical protein
MSSAAVTLEPTGVSDPGNNASQTRPFYWSVNSVKNCV